MCRTIFLPPLQNVCVVTTFYTLVRILSILFSGVALIIIICPPLCKGRWHGDGVPRSEFMSFGGSRLAVTEGLFYYVLPRVQSLSRFATAPFTQGSLRCSGNCAKLKLFGTTSTAGGFRLTKSMGRSSKKEGLPMLF